METSKSSVTRVRIIIMNHVSQTFGIIIIIGVEKNSDDTKNYISSNKHNALGDILRAEARLEALQRGMIVVVPDIKYYNHTNHSCSKNLSQS